MGVGITVFVLHAVRKVVYVRVAKDKRGPKRGPRVGMRAGGRKEVSSVG